MRIIKLFLILLSFLYSIFVFAQPAWHNTFINDANQISTFVVNGSNDYFAFSYSSSTYLRSTNGGISWVPLLGFDSSYTINSGQFVNANTGWLVGQNWWNSTGEVFRTTDAGSNWIKQFIDVHSVGMNSVFFIDQNTGFIGTYSNPASILRTTNGGLNWMSTNFTNGYLVGNIEFVNAITGWSVVEYPSARVIRTTDLGVSWQNVSSNSSELSNLNITAINAINENSCWAMATKTVNSIIYTYFYKTNNSGINWMLEYTYNSPQNYFNRLHFINDLIGYAYSGSNVFLKTSNGGLTWSAISTQFQTNINDICFKSDSIIFSGGGTINGAPYNNYILKSTNAGINWSLINHNRDFTFSILQFIDGNTGFAVTDTGRLYRTSNFGGDWNLVHYDPSFPISCVAFRANRGILGGYNGIIKCSSDYGNNWQLVNMPYSLGMNKVCFVDEQNCWEVSYGDTSGGKVMKSTNSGLNWNIFEINQPRHYNLQDVCFENNMTGWILGFWTTHYPYPFPNNYESAILKTTNSGQNWNRISSWVNYNDWNYSEFKFLNDNVGFVYKHNGLMKTTDGGSTWYSLPSLGNYEFTLKTASFLNNNTYLIGGLGGVENGGIFRTTNGGANWQTIYYFLPSPLETVHSIWAVDTNKIMFSCDYSHIYATTNGGGIFGISLISGIVPTHNLLHQNYPNPFNPVTKIKFELKEFSSVKLTIYDLLGREVYAIDRDRLSPGVYEYLWDGTNYASGVYFYKIEAGSFTETKRMILVK